MHNSLKRKGIITLTHFVLLFIFAAAMDVINRYYYFIFIAAGFFCLNPKRKIYVDSIPLSMLGILAVSWVLFSPSTTTSIFAPLKPFTYALCYILGMSLMNDDKEYSENKTSYKLFYFTAFVVAFGSMVHYLLNWLLNMDADDRYTIDFWTRRILAATGQAALACLPLALAIACIFSKNNKYIKLSAIATLVLVFIYNLILSGRTLIIISLIAAGVAFLHQFASEKNTRFRIFLILLVVIIAILFMYQIDLFGVRTFVEESPFYDRFFSEDSAIELEEDGRMDMKIYHLQNMGRFLFGGAHIREEIGYAHDIFLDTYDEAGIFAFIAIIIYMLATVSHLVKFLKDKSIPFSARQIVLCIYVVLYIEFFVEPILQGMPWLFATFCLIDGYVSRILNHNEVVRGNECNL